MAKNTGFRPAKKLVFDDKPGTSEKRALLSDHLSMVQHNQTMKNSLRQSKIDSEREEMMGVVEDIRNQDDLNYD